jgi:uracil-DNA glycosylase
MNEKPSIKLNSEWLEVLQPEFEAEYMKDLRSFLVERGRAGATIYPPISQIFAALDATPLSAVRVVILGQDPYHGAGQAHGLCFSVLPGVPPPPSLVNIFKELNSDLGITIPKSGTLTNWAEQGVLLLNTVLTVEKGQPGAHQGRGWERFTDAVMAAISQRAEPTVFMLWGSQAQRKVANLDLSRHLVLKAPHPSPLSAYRGFLGCRHFSRANQWLVEQGYSPIDWALPSDTA